LGALSVDTFTVTSKDGSATGTVSINISGTNDPATIKVEGDLIEIDDELSVFNELTETDEVLTVSGTATVTDPDAGESQFIAQTVEGEFGTFTLTAEGQWNFTASSELNSLKDGEVVTETFTIESEDKSASLPVVVQITGTNDRPVLTASQADLAAGNENFAYEVSTAELLEGYTDAELDDLSIENLVADNGEVNVTETGYRITPTEGFNGMVTLTYKVIDNQGGEVETTQSYTLTPANLAPEVSGAAELLGTEDDGLVTVSALANVTDPEGDALTVVGVPNDADLPSGISFDAISQVFTLDTTDASFQDLGEGDIRTIDISYAISDGRLETPQTATFTITGANDTATATVSAVAAVNEVAYGTTGATVNVNVAR
jgi:VCBS repeat-containing protein